MKLYRFSPIKTNEQLLEAIKYTHSTCYKLCKQSFGKYLPNAGNIGIFCHYDSEYDYLTTLREELTEPSDNFNQKYFRLHEPIVIPSADDVPETTYTYLYIRKPDPYRYQVGDLDFYLEQSEYDELKQSLLNGTSNIKGARAFDRTDLDMIELHDPEADVLGYVSTHKMTERVRIKQ
jgi:hypothetical protein